MIKNEGIQQISKSAQLNTEKVYEVVDGIVTTLAQNFPSCQVAYNEEQNRFGTVIKYLNIIITPLFKSVEVVISDNTEPIFTALLGIDGSYKETRVRFSEEYRNLLQTFLWDLSQIDISQQEFESVSEAEEVSVAEMEVEESTDAVEQKPEEK